MVQQAAHHRRPETLLAEFAGRVRLGADRQVVVAVPVKVI
jgi:hypothetical protein